MELFDKNSLNQIYREENQYVDALANDALEFPGE